MKNKAEDFEKRDVSRTYFVLDEEALNKEKPEIKVLGFYTLALKSLKLSDDTSKNQKKKLSGGFKNEEIDNIPVYLIGQLAKNDCYSKEIRGREIMERAIISIRKCHNILGGRAVMVECDDKEKVVSFYKNECNFKILQKDEDGLVQMISYL